MTTPGDKSKNLKTRFIPGPLPLPCLPFCFCFFQQNLINLLLIRMPLDDSASNSHSNQTGTDSQNDQLSVWMKAAQNGDQTAYRQVLEAAQPLLETYVNQKVSSPEEAEEIIQQVLIRVHAYRHTFQARSRFKTWLLTIARNVLKEHYKKKSKHSIESGELVEEASMMQVGSDQDAILAIKQAFQKLPKASKAALIKVKRDGMDTREAAKTENIQHSALKVRVHRAYQTFKEKLKEKEIE